MPDLNKRIDPLSFPILGLLGAVACGPLAPQTGETDGTSDGTGTESTTAGPTTGPTDPTTDPTTTEPPMPECQSSADCDHVYCGYCSEGMCRESVGCCGYYGAERVDTKWRCSPAYDCYSDDECAYGYVCMFGECIESAPIPLPSCAPPDGDQSEWNLGTAPSAFILADLDGDLDLDLASSHPLSGTIEIAFNNGAGDFTLAGATIDLDLGQVATGDLALAAGDLDNDGDIDLVVTRHEADGVLHLLFNDGVAFTGDARPTAPLPVQVFIADVNGDGALDLATVNEGEPRFGVHLGDGAGNFSPEQPGIADTIGARAWVGDLSLDGVADLLAPLPGAGSFMAWTGNAGPLLEPLRQFEAPDVASMALVGADLDLQGLPDVVLAHPQGDLNGMVQVWAGISPGEWGLKPRQFLTSKPLRGGPLTELDALPGPDLIAATGQNSVVVLPGDGKGGFACEHILDIAGTTAPDLIAVGDVDNDGRPDILAGAADTPTVSLIRLIF